MCYQVLLQISLQCKGNFQNFRRPTKTVFCQEPRFSGGLRYFQKEGSPWMMNHATFNLRTDKNIFKSGILFIQIVGYRSEWSDSSSSNFNHGNNGKNHLENNSKKPFAVTTRRQLALNIWNQLKMMPIFWNTLELDPETKRQSMKWHSVTSLKPKIARLSKSKTKKHADLHLWWPRQNNKCRETKH